MEKPQTLDDAKQAVSQAVETVGVPVVVLVDEVDRLERHEVKAIAQAVRAVADFPRVAYVLAYDRERVIAHLGDDKSERGSAYLEKIVQHAITVPPPTPQALRRVFDDNVGQLLELNAIKPTGPR